MESIFEGISQNEEGYLLIRSPIPDRDEVKPLVLLCAEELWLKFHPRFNRIGENDSKTLLEDREEDETFDDLKTNEAHDLKVKKMVHLPNMYNRIVSVLNNIDKMRDCNKTKSGITETAMQNSLEEGEEEKYHAKHISIERIVRIWNSIRLLFPIISDLLNHESKNDNNFLKNKCSTEVELKPGKQWMLGKYVYDISSKKVFPSLQRQMKMILMAFLTSKETHSLVAGNGDWKLINPLRCLESSGCYVETCKDVTKILNLNTKQFEAAQAIDATLNSHFSCIRKQQEGFSRSVFRVKKVLESVLVSRFPGCKLEVYGSCLSDLSIGESSDVDISIYIPELHQAKNRLFRNEINATAYQNIVKRFVYAVYGRLCNKSDWFFNLQPVARARVPVVKGCYRLAGNPLSKDGSLNFDICFSNEIAVRNSELLREYSNVCYQSKALMVLVKKWAKDNKVSSAADEKLSSYAWTILVIFYLQKIGLLPNLQCPELIKAGCSISQKDSFDNIDGLDTKFLSWDTLKDSGLWYPSENVKNVPLIILFHGFFHFLTNCYPYGFMAMSIRKASLIPKTYFSNCSLSFFSIEDPFETYDSNRPHDLACPVSHAGAEEILSYLARTEEQLRLLLSRNSRACHNIHDEDGTSNSSESKAQQTQKIDFASLLNKNVVTGKKKRNGHKKSANSAALPLVTLFKDMKIAEEPSSSSVPQKTLNTASVQDAIHVEHDTSRTNQESLKKSNINQQQKSPQQETLFDKLDLSTETSQSSPKSIATNSVKSENRRKSRTIRPPEASRITKKAEIGHGTLFGKPPSKKTISQNSSSNMGRQQRKFDKAISGNVSEEDQEFLANRNRPNQSDGAPHRIHAPKGERMLINNFPKRAYNKIGKAQSGQDKSLPKTMSKPKASQKSKATKFRKERNSE